MSRRWIAWTLWLLLMLAPAPLHAQEAAAPAAPETEADALGRSTPRGTLNGFLGAVAEKDYSTAARYLDLSGLPRGQQGNGPQLARSLEVLLDRQGWVLTPNAVSNDPVGNRGDDQPDDTDVIAQLRTDSGNLPVTARRVADTGGEQIWLISRDFVRRIPSLEAGSRPGYLDRLVPGALDSFHIFGAGIGHWLVMLILYAVSYLAAGILIRGVLGSMRRILRRGKKALRDELGFVDKLEMPLRIFLMVWLAGLAALPLGISIVVRNFFTPIGATIAWIAAGFFLWHLSDVLVAGLERRLARQERFALTSVLEFARRMLKFLFIFLVAILVLHTYGVNVTAGLAALGIGGIALALGAQKTLENFIGSLSIIADRPLHVGDFCRVGNVSGVVTEIGMRSTRLRTNEQTIVTIPNGFLSSEIIENFARRQRFLLNRRMTLRYDATSEQLRRFVGRLEEIVAAQPKFAAEPGTVRMLGFTEAGYLVEIWGHVNTGDFTEFLRVQAAITYEAMDAARDCGLSFAIPAQTVLE